MQTMSVELVHHLKRFMNENTKEEWKLERKFFGSRHGKKRVFNTEREHDSVVRSKNEKSQWNNYSNVSTECV